jgi:dTDP-4-dehydrorhamnose reductase
MADVLILGSHGMLGSVVTGVLSELPGLRVTATARTDSAALPARVSVQRFDVRKDELRTLLDDGAYDWIVNAIGVTNAHIDQRVSASIENAIAVNALFPHRLAAECSLRGQRVIQIATDGVFSGTGGPYDEGAPHDALDVYGKTKSLGEVPDGSVIHLRCSIVGRERSAASSLLERVISSPAGSQLAGYGEHRWNGITTLHFAKLCAALIRGVQTPSLQHVVPADSVSKAELLELGLSAFGRQDVAVVRVPGPGAPIDRTLRTRDPESNRRLWRCAGYEQPPTIAEMLRELAAHDAGDAQVVA